MHSVYIAYYKNTNDVNIDRKIKYKETIDYFDMPSAVIFDTSCLDIIQEIVYPQEIRSLEGEDRED